MERGGTCVEILESYRVHGQRSGWEESIGSLQLPVKVLLESSYNYLQIAS